MLPTLREVLAMPSFQAADFKILTGEPDTAVVRWVHSSEVYEMGGLLSGGEVLLTSGLGLHGRSAAQLTAYIDLIADAGCVALAMEVGRSFFEVPSELVEASHRRGLVFLALHSVVPFERMVEDFHDLLLRRKVSSSRAGEPVWQELLGLVVAGQGMTALLNAVSRLAGCEVELRDLDEQVVDRSKKATPTRSSQRTVADVRGPSGSVGTLVLYAAATPRRSAVANRAAVAVALELGRHPELGQRPSLAQAVVTDLSNGSLVSDGDVSERLAAVGWTASDGRHVLVAAVDVDQRTPAHEVVPYVVEPVQEVLGNCVVGAASNHVVVLAHGWRRLRPAQVREAFSQVYERLCCSIEGASVRTVGVASPVRELSDVSGAVVQAREVLAIARRFGTRSGVLMARDVGVQRLLGAVAPNEVSVFITEQLGALLAFDTQHSADLVRTLDAYLANGCSKTRTADVLGIRRQSLYARLERIEKLLGVCLDDSGQVGSLGLAMTAWRMRTGLDPQAAFDRR